MGNTFIISVPENNIFWFPEARKSLNLSIFLTGIRTQKFSVQQFEETKLKLLLLLLEKFVYKRSDCIHHDVFLEIAFIEQTLNWYQTVQIFFSSTRKLFQLQDKLIICINAIAQCRTWFSLCLIDPATHSELLIQMRGVLRGFAVCHSNYDV